VGLVFSEWNREHLFYFADVVKQSRDFDLIHMFFGNIQFSSDSNRPFRQSRAMYPGALEIEQLVKRAD